MVQREEDMKFVITSSEGFHLRYDYEGDVMVTSLDYDGRRHVSVAGYTVADTRKERSARNVAGDSRMNFREDRGRAQPDT